MGLQVTTEKMLRKQLGERLNADMSDKKELIRKHVSGHGGADGAAAAACMAGCLKLLALLSL